MNAVEIPCPTPSAPSNGEPAVAVPSMPASARERLRAAIAAVSVYFSAETLELRFAWEAFEADVPPTPAEDDEAHAIVAELASWAADESQYVLELDVIVARAHGLIDRIAPKEETRS